MNAFFAALWSETLKARRSRVPLATAGAFAILPLAGGLFMLILKNPEQARAMGLISMKAQLTGGVADWPTYFQMLVQGSAIGGGILFAFVTAWVFGREFSDHTAKELLALPTPRGMIVGAKFVVTGLWVLGLTPLTFLIALGIGSGVGIPGWSLELERASFLTLLGATLLDFMLMPLVAFLASAGRGYLPPLGWAFLTLALGQIFSILGWGDWFPWAVPALYSGMAGPRAEQLGVHSYVVMSLTFLTGLAATFVWWQTADHAR